MCELIIVDIYQRHEVGGAMNFLSLSSGIYLFIFIFIGIFICNGNMHSNGPIVVREYILFHLIVFNYIINPVFGFRYLMIIIHKLWKNGGRPFRP